MTKTKKMGGQGRPPLQSKTKFLSNDVGVDDSVDPNAQKHTTNKCQTT